MTKRAVLAEAYVYESPNQSERQPVSTAAFTSGTGTQPCVR